MVAVGGDGTVNETVNGLTDEGGRPLGTLGVIVTGRGRDVCRNLGVSSDPTVAARRILEEEDVLVDLGPGAAPARFPISWASWERSGRTDRCRRRSSSTIGPRGRDH